MKSQTVLVLLFCLASSSHAFVSRNGGRGLPLSQAGSTTTTRLHSGIELEPEPAGGKEINAVTSSMPGCRVKEMQVLPTKSDLGTPYQFWMTAEVDGTLIKEIRAQILKDASKKANFPGFRKGQIPPYAQPQITNFSIQEAIIKTVQAVVDAYGLQALEGSDGEVEVKEDVGAMSKKYKTGDSLQFTATINAAYDPQVARLANDTDSVAPEQGIVDAEIVE